MSEYIKYFIVKSDSENEVKEKLNKSKIISIVDSGMNEFYFLEKYKKVPKSNWVTVHAPALSGFKTPGLVQSFYYRNVSTSYGQLLL